MSSFQAVKYQIEKHFYLLFMILRNRAGELRLIHFDPTFAAPFLANVANSCRVGRWHRILQSGFVVSFPRGHFTYAHSSALWTETSWLHQHGSSFPLPFPPSSRGNFKPFRRYEANFCEVPRRIELTRRLIIARLLIAGNDRQRRNRNG